MRLALLAPHAGARLSQHGCLRLWIRLRHSGFIRRAKAKLPPVIVILRTLFDTGIFQRIRAVSSKCASPNTGPKRWSNTVSPSKSDVTFRGMQMG